VLVRPPDLVVDESDTVWPGLHRFAEQDNRDAGYGVVWWDPRALTLGIKQSFGIRQEELLKEPDDPEVLKNDLKTYESWRTSWDDVKKKAGVAGVVFRTATAESRRGDFEGSPPEVELVELPRDGERPAGARFGALVHATLATVPLDANSDQIRQVASLHARVLGADDRETEAASAAVQRTLSHPLLQRAREAWRRGQCRRETPITLTQTDGSLIEGVLDLAFLQGEEWTIVDFKTDRELDQQLPHYQRQVGLYASAVSRATGKSASAILISV
jgi:ATP-dependent helicase/nuclease subunit A